MPESERRPWTQQGVVETPEVTGAGGTSGDALIGELDQTLSTLVHQWRRDQGKLRGGAPPATRAEPGSPSSPAEGSPRRARSAAAAASTPPDQSSGALPPADPVALAISRMEEGLAELRLWDRVWGTVTEDERM
jgi:hypothetical protein